jgi:tetratricopeptide (TPR) repeat protein
MNPRITLLQELLEASPGDSFTLFALAKEYEKAGQLDQALHFFERLRTAQPEYVGLYYHLGKVHEALQDPQKAIETYRAGMAVAHNAGDRHAWSELNGARFAAGDDDDDD